MLEANPVGRPSQYKPEYCKRMIELAKSGKTPVALAAEVGVSKQTVYSWGKENPEFLDSLNVAKALREHWLLTQADEMMLGNSRGNDRLLVFMLNTQHGYKETSAVESIVKSTVEVSFSDIQDDPSTTAL